MNSPHKVISSHKAATTLELFFDLVFVFAITQVVYQLTHDLSWAGAARAVILLGVLWWGWTNWTWATNIVDMSPRWKRIVMLAAMGATFVMAHSVPTAFDGDGLWVAIPYLVMTQLGGALTFNHLRFDIPSLKGLLKFSPISIAGGVLLVVGAIVDSNQELIWLSALLLTVLASELGGRARWELVASHFAERHGLIMIIALGEAIIAVGVTLARHEETLPSTTTATYLLLGIGFAMTLYWAYFDRANQLWEESMAQQQVHAVGRYAVRVYAWTHFPIIVGIVFSAVAMEEIFLHPDESLHGFTSHLLSIAILSFFGAMALGAWLTRKHILVERMVAIALILVIVYGFTNLSGLTVLASIIAVLICSFTIEYLRFTHKHRPVTEDITH